MFSQKDIIQIQQHGLTVDQLNDQITQFKTGFTFLDVEKPATINDGILRIEKSEESEYVQQYSGLIKDKKLLKFVPASGAATRMFKQLFEYIGNSNDEKVLRDIDTFISSISRFAFYNELDKTIALKGNALESLIQRADYKNIIKNLLDKEGLNYGALPKGLLKFHTYTDGVRTPIEEHMVEGALYALTGGKKVNLHFTVSPEHIEGFNSLVTEVVQKFEKQFNCQFHISYSIQKPSTDTIAVDEHNQPFREKDGSLVFRPGGHGALLENLDELDADVIFIKNIDNVAPDRLKEVTVNYKKALATILLKNQEKVFGYIRELNSAQLDASKLKEIHAFIEKNLGYKFSESFSGLDNNSQKTSLLKVLNRPIRVCGMVKNTGEPGGGPFWVKGKDGSQSLQILESSQFDFTDSKQKAVFASATHFNPVDLVVSPKDVNSDKFSLLQFRDPETGFISIKSKDGKELKALELPGLWNGTMAFWNTIFVEVPIETFNPVKTVLDLVREEHLG